MYNPEHKQYILKNSFGVAYHVYFESGRGICIRMLGDSRIWSRGYVLSDTAINYYSVVLDKDDIFHFIFQASDGRILYGQGKHGQIDIQPILTSKDITPWKKHVSLFIVKDTVLFFYTLRYQKKYLISMQTYKDGILSKPAAIDYVDGGDANYVCFIDHHEKCHLIYINTENTTSRLFHRVLKDDFSLFGAPEKLYSCEQTILSPSAIVTTDGQMHLLFHVEADSQYQVMYENLSANKTVEILYKNKTSPGNTGLIYSNVTLSFFRVSNDIIYYRSLTNAGKSWADEVQYPFPKKSPLTCFIYHTYYQKEAWFRANTVPGCFSHGYQLAFFTEDIVAPVLPEPRTTMDKIANDGLPKPSANNPSPPSSAGKSDPADTNPAYKEIQKKVTLLQNLTENMQREMTKMWLTQKDYEKKLEQLQSQYQLLRNDLRYIPDDKFDYDSTAAFQAEKMEKRNSDIHARKEIEKDTKANMNDVLYDTDWIDTSDAKAGHVDAEMYRFEADEM